MIARVGKTDGKVEIEPLVLIERRATPQLIKRQAENFLSGGICQDNLPVPILADYSLWHDLEQHALRNINQFAFIYPPFSTSLSINL